MKKTMKAAVVRDFGKPLPPGSFPLPIIDMVLDGITLRGSIVGTRLDLQEALAFAGEGAVKATVQTERLEDINGVFDGMRAGQIEGARRARLRQLTRRYAWHYWGLDRFRLERK